MERFMDKLSLCEFAIDNSRRLLFHKVKSLGKFIKRGKARYYEKCRIIAVEGKVVFRIQGTEFYIQSNPSNNLIFDVYYTDIKEVLEADRSSELVFKVFERTLIINNRKLSCEIIEMKKGEFDIEAGLGTLNFGEVNTKSPSWQKQVFKMKNTGEEVHIETLRKDAEKAALILKKYKVDSNKILHLIVEGLK